MGRARGAAALAFGNGLGGATTAALSVAFGCGGGEMGIGSGELNVLSLVVETVVDCRGRLRLGERTLSDWRREAGSRDAAGSGLGSDMRVRLGWYVSSRCGGGDRELAEGDGARLWFWLWFWL